MSAVKKLRKRAGASFALYCLVAPLFLFIALEIIFAAFGFPEGASTFVENIVVHEKLSTRKPPGEYRIFTYGESTIHGAGYAPASSPSRWLEAYLHDFLPEKKIRVVNFGRMGQGSYFNYHSYLDTLPYKPDLVIFYMGHNTFLPGNRFDEVKQRQNTLGCRIRKWTRKSHFFSAVSRLVIQIHLRLKAGGKEEDAMEYKVIETWPSKENDRKNGISRNDPYFWQNIAFFKENVLKIQNLSDQKKIPTLFFKPVSNLKNFPPGLSDHLKILTREELSRWKEFYQRGKEAQKQRDFDRALSFYEQAYQIDSTYATLSFRLGQVYFQKRNFTTSLRFFEEARDNDLLICRATKITLEILDDLQKSGRIQLIDTEKILTYEVQGGILGEPIIEDNVHFSIKGHSLVGKALAHEIAERDLITPFPKWQFNRERPYEEIFKEFNISKDLMFLVDLRLINYFGRRYSNRIRLAHRALAIYPNDPRALRYLAWSYWIKGDQQKALQVYKTLHEVDPSSLAAVFSAQPSIEKAFLFL